MTKIATLTLNPAIDISSEADNVQPTQKTRIFGERIEPGGGGINVARALAGFGQPVHAIYLAGGPTGRALDHMLDIRCIERTWIEIEGETRLSLTVHDRQSGLEYRFIPEGPEVAENEWRECLAKAAAADCDYLVASGSLPRGVPDDFYAQLGSALHAKGVRFVLDTSGNELKSALERGGLFLVKPSWGELGQFAGHDLATMDDIRSAAHEVVHHRQAEHVAVTMGEKGALLVNRDGSWFLPAVSVEVRSAVGAGDSFLAAMTFGFASGLSATEAFRRGVAAGAAAVEAPGQELCKRSDVDRLLEHVPPI